MRMLHGLADGDEEFQSLASRQMLLVTELGDRNAMDEFHDEVGPATVGRAHIEHLGDVRVVHQRQGLAFGLEPGDHLLRVHPRLDDLEGHPSCDRLLLLGHVDDAHAAFANLLQQLVGTDAGAGAFAGEAGRWWDHFSAGIQKASWLIMGCAAVSSSLARRSGSSPHLFRQAYCSCGSRPISLQGGQEMVPTFVELGRP